MRTSMKPPHAELLEFPFLYPERGRGAAGCPQGYPVGIFTPKGKHPPQFVAHRVKPEVLWCEVRLASGPWCNHSPTATPCHRKDRLCCHQTALRQSSTQKPLVPLFSPIFPAEKQGGGSGVWLPAAPLLGPRPP